MEIVIPYFIWVRWAVFALWLYLAYKSIRTKSKTYMVLTVLSGLFFFVANPKIDFTPTKVQTDRANAKTAERHKELPPLKVDDSFETNTNKNFQPITSKELE